MSRVSQYGFQWGPFVVERVADLGSHFALRVQAGDNMLAITASKKGQRVYLDVYGPGVTIQSRDPGGCDQ